MKKILILFWGIVAFVQADIAQIVNIEGKRINSDTTGFDGQLEGNFSMNQNNTFLASLNTKAQVQYKWENDLVLLVGDWRFAVGDQQRFLNDGMLHLRYNRKINNWLRLEAFSQIQYNELLSVRFRFLLGFGPRFKLTGNSEVFKMYLGPMYMLEYEDVKSDDTTHVDSRMSTYLSWTLDPPGPFSFTATTYYQPLLKDWEDFRLSEVYNVKFRVIKRLDFKVDFNFMFDSRPPSTIRKFIFALATGVIFKFRS